MSPQASSAPLAELVAHLTRTTPLAGAQAARVVEEVLGYLDEEVEPFVRRRHRELQQAGLANEEIFGVIAAEVDARRFSAPRLSARQLRRIVYG